METWNQKIKYLLKREMAKKDISYDRLAKMLQAIGVKETKATVHQKIIRGTFSAAFLMQCLYVLGDINIDIDLCSPLYASNTVEDVEFEVV